MLIAHRVSQLEEARHLLDIVADQALRRIRRQAHRDARLRNVAKVQIEIVLLVDEACLLPAHSALQRLGQLVLELLRAPQPCLLRGIYIRNG